MSENSNQSASCNTPSVLIDTSCLKIQINPLEIRNLNGAEVLYEARTIEVDGHYYYSGLGSLIEISRIERDSVIQNPKLFYFSTALKLHNRLTKQALSFSVLEDNGGHHE